MALNAVAAAGAPDTASPPLPTRPAPDPLAAGADEDAVVDTAGAAGLAAGTAAEGRATRAAPGPRFAELRAVRAEFSADLVVAADPGALARDRTAPRPVGALASLALELTAGDEEPSSPVSAPATACGPARKRPTANAAAPVRAALFLREAAARERVDFFRAAIF